MDGTGIKNPPPLTFSGEVVQLRPRCGPTQHDYWQGSSMQGESELERLLYCRNCGDVITFALPREESIE